MGNSSSKAPRTREQEDLKYLGDRFAFGDKELWHLYQAYHAIIHDKNDTDKNNNSFLTDWAIQSTLILELQERQKQQQKQLKLQQQQQQQKQKHGVDKKNGGVVQEQQQQFATNLSRMSDQEFTDHLQALKQERLDSLKVVEQHILPVDLGNRLYRATCVAPGDDACLYPIVSPLPAVDENNSQQKKSTTTSAAPPTTTRTVDEYTRKTRLTQMFEGFSNMGRRGSKSYLQVMFQACRQQQRRSNGITVQVVSALEMVDMGYRLALAAEYLQQRHINFHKNINSNIVNESDPSSPENHHQKEGNSHDTSSDDNKADEQDEDNDDDVIAVDVTTLLPPPPPPTSSWSLEDLSLSSSNSKSKTMLNSSLRALARSMIEKGKRRRERTNNGSSDVGGGMIMYPPQYPDGSSSYVSGTSDNNNDEDDGFVELDDIIEWSEEVAPLFASALPTFIYRILFPVKPFPPSQTPFSYPRILQESSFFVGSSSHNNNNSVVHANASPMLFGLACFSSSLSGLYFRLYTSASDGLSFNRLQNALLGYGGPTCIIIRAVADKEQQDSATTNVDDDDDDDNAGGIFGAVSASPWKESKDFYGTSDCFLFQLSPITAVYRPTSVARSSADHTSSSSSSKNTTTSNKKGAGSGNNNGPNYMYCNPHARSKGYDGQAHGIGFGGTVDQPRLFLDETFEQCYAGSQDYTFENGALLPPCSNRRKQYFQVESLEVWGVGGTALVEKALDARQLARDVRQEGIRRARKVDKAQFLDDFRSGAIDSKAFAHRTQIDGRADYDCNERHAKTYHNEK